MKPTRKLHKLQLLLEAALPLDVSVKMPNFVAFKSI